MSAEPARDDHAGKLGVMIDDEMRVGGVGVETRAHRQDRPIGAWNMFPQARPERLLVGWTQFTIHLIRIRCAAGRVKRELESWRIGDHRKSVPDAPARP